MGKFPIYFKEPKTSKIVRREICAFFQKIFFIKLSQEKTKIDTCFLFPGKFLIKRFKKVLLYGIIKEYY